MLGNISRGGSSYFQPLSWKTIYLEDDHRMLVYEFMPRGSLENHLFRRSSYFQPLSWNLRIKIPLGAAKGLAYLHSPGAKVIYRDFKSSNILIDSNYNAKLSDFGLPKDRPVDGKSYVSTRVLGTYGYAAPEYMVTEKYFHLAENDPHGVPVPIVLHRFQDQQGELGLAIELGWKWGWVQW